MPRQRCRQQPATAGLHIAAIPLTFVNQWIGVAVYVLAAMIWLVPDRKIREAGRKIDLPILLSSAQKIWFFD